MDCAGEPYLVEIPADLPYAHLGMTTCDLGDHDSTTCLGASDDGEDAFYELTVTETTTIEITLDPQSTTDTGLAIDNICPLHPSGCMELSTSSVASPHSICQTLAPGTYYVMVDKSPMPICIPDYDLTIETAGSCS
jgi:hypothetical protein